MANLKLDKEITAKGEGCGIGPGADRFGRGGLNKKVTVRKPHQRAKTILAVDA